MARTTVPLLGRADAAGTAEWRGLSETATGTTVVGSAAADSGVSGSMSGVSVSAAAVSASAASVATVVPATSAAPRLDDPPRPPRRRRRRTGRPPASSAAASAILGSGWDCTSGRDSNWKSACVSFRALCRGAACRVSARASVAISTLGASGAAGCGVSPISVSKYFGCNGSGALALSLAVPSPPFFRRLSRSLIHLRI